MKHFSKFIFISAMLTAIFFNVGQVLAITTAEAEATYAAAIATAEATRTAATAAAESDFTAALATANTLPNPSPAYTDAIIAAQNAHTAALAAATAAFNSAAAAALAAYNAAIAPPAPTPPPPIPTPPPTPQPTNQSQPLQKSKFIPDCALQNPGPGVNEGDCRSVGIFVTLLIDFSAYLFTIVGALALLFFIYGGFTLILSRGTTDQVKKGKDIMVAAVIGLIIVFGAYMLVRFLGTAVGLKGGYTLN